jgi:hypothetical protein
MAYYESVTKVMSLFEECIAKKSIAQPESYSRRMWSVAQGQMARICERAGLLS